MSNVQNRISAAHIAGAITLETIVSFAYIFPRNISLFFVRYKYVAKTRILCTEEKVTDTRMTKYI